MTKYICNCCEAHLDDENPDDMVRIGVYNEQAPDDGVSRFRWPSYHCTEHLSGFSVYNRYCGPLLEIGPNDCAKCGETRVQCDDCGEFMELCWECDHPLPLEQVCDTCASAGLPELAEEADDAALEDRRNDMLRRGE